MDNLQRWSRIFRSEETETDLSIWIPTEISGIFGIMESTPGVAYWSRHASNWVHLSGRNSGTEESHPLSFRLSYSAALLFFPNQQLITIVIMIENRLGGNGVLHCPQKHCNNVAKIMQFRQQVENFGKWDSLESNYGYFFPHRLTCTVMVFFFVKWVSGKPQTQENVRLKLTELKMYNFGHSWDNVLKEKLRGDQIWKKLFSISMKGIMNW